MDRGGNLIWADDFEAAAAAKWAISCMAGGTAALSTERAWMGNQSMKTVTHTDAGDTSAIAKSFCLPVERRMAIEFMFCMTTEKPIITAYIVGYTGTGWFEAQVKYNHNEQKLYYTNSAGTDVELTRYDSTVTLLEPWFYMKLAVDWDTRKYIRFIFNSTEYDLSTISMRSGSSANKKHIEVCIFTEAGTAAAATVYYDNFILTQNEP